MSVLGYFLITTRTLSSLPGHTYGRRSGGAGEHTVPAGRVEAHFRGLGICLCFAEAKRRSDLERGRRDLAQLEVVVGTGENFSSFLQGTEAITASYGGAG